MRAGIGLGSNLGNRLVNLRQARHMILSLPFVEPTYLSAPLFETSPVDCADSAPDFLNTVVEIRLADAATPETLLSALRETEVALGRPQRHPKNVSRSVDLDILYMDDMQMHTPTLTLPHPRMHQRRFVLAPLAAIRPELVLPGQQRSVRELLEALNDPAAARMVSESW